MNIELKLLRLLTHATTKGTTKALIITHIRVLLEEVQLHEKGRRIDHEMRLGNQTHPGMEKPDDK